MFNLCFTSEASASILRDDRKRVTNINNETTVSRWIDTTSNDSSLRSRRVVTTRQHFQPASPPKSRVDFSHDGSSWTRRVVTNRHHFQKVPRTFFQVGTSCYFTAANTTTRLPLDGSSSPKSGPDSVRVYWTTLQKSPLTTESGQGNFAKGIINR